MTLLIALFGLAAFFMALRLGKKVRILGERVHFLEATLAEMRSQHIVPRVAPRPAASAKTEPIAEPTLPEPKPEIPPQPKEEILTPTLAALTAVSSPEGAEPVRSEEPVVREGGTQPDTEPATVTSSLPPEETPPEPDRDWESRIGKRWLTWAGVMLLVASAGFLIKYAYDQGWIGPWSQVGIGTVLGCGLCFAGDWQIRKRDLRAFGQGVMALGLTLVYLTSFGAFAFFKLEAVSQMTALFLLAATSGAGVLLANRHRSLPICVLSTLGGYLAPVLVSTGKPPPVSGLFSYTLIVGVGVIAVAILRSWPALPLLALVGTMAHFWGWHGKFYVPEQAALAATWAAIFHFFFLILPALPLIRGGRSTPWQWLLPPLNAMAGVYAVWIHLHGEYPLALLGLLVAMAVAHIAIGVRGIRGPQADRRIRGIYASIGLAILALAPLTWFGVQGSLVCWLVLGLLLLDLGFRLDFRVFRVFAWVNLAVGVVWSVVKFRTPVDQSYLGEVLRLGLGNIDSHAIAVLYGNVELFLLSLFSLAVFWTRLAVPAALLAALCLLQRWRGKDSGGNVRAKMACGVAAGFLAAVFISLDVNPYRWLTASPGGGAYDRAWVLIPLWCLGVLTAEAGRRFHRPGLGWWSFLFLVPAGYLAFRDIYLSDYRVPLAFLAHPGYLAGTLFPLAVMYAAYCMGGSRRALAVGIAGYLLVFSQHAEVWNWAQTAGRETLKFWGCSLVWTTAAAVYSLIAWRRGDRALGRCYWFVLLIGFGLAVYAMLMKGEVRPFVNMPFVAVLWSVCALFIGARFLPGRGGIWLAIVGGWLLLGAFTLEVKYWVWYSSRAVEGAGLLSADDWSYRRYGALALLWVAGAVVYADLRRRFGRWELLVGLAVPLYAALSIVIYLLNLRQQLNPLPTPFFNTAFLAGLLLSTPFFLAGMASVKRRDLWAVAGGTVLLLVLHCEFGYRYGPWLRHQPVNVCRAWYTILWAVGAAGYLVASVKYRKPRLFWAAFATLAVSVFCWLRQYAGEYPDGYILFLNFRFLSSLSMLTVLVALCQVASLYRPGISEGGFVEVGRGFRTVIYMGAAAVGLALASLECRQWCLQHFGDPEEARKMAKAAVSIVWAVYSITLLVIGFVTRIRGWRLAGLGLFAATCIKLVLFDLSHLELLQRIFAFMAVGLLLMAASYLYHKMEKRMNRV